jgi:hypothetical protein
MKQDINQLNELPDEFIDNLSIDDKFKLAIRFCHSGNLNNYSIWQHTESARALFKEIQKNGNQSQSSKATDYLEDCKSDFGVIGKLIRIIFNIHN